MPDNTSTTATLTNTTVQEEVKTITEPLPNVVPANTETTPKPVPEKPSFTGNTSGSLFGKKADDLLSQKKEEMAERLKTAILTSQTEDEEKKESIVITSVDESFTYEGLVKTWKDYVRQIEKASLSFIKERTLKLSETNMVSIVLGSNHEKSLFEDQRLNIIQFLRTQLKNTTIDVEFTIDPTLIPETKSLSVEDKFNKMTEQNPNLATLRQLLELELDY